MAVNYLLFYKEYADLTDVQKVVFSETLFDLDYKRRQSIQEGKYTFPLVPRDRILDNKITERYDLNNATHVALLSQDRQVCLDLLQKLEVISKMELHETVRNNKEIEIIVGTNINTGVLIEIQNVVRYAKDNEEAMSEKWIAEEEAREECEMSSVDMDPIMYEIEYREPKIVLKGADKQEVVLKKTSYGSENDKVFRYMYEHPNQLISLEEINIYLRGVSDTEIKRGLFDILKDLKLVGKLGELFIKKRSKHHVYFKNPVHWSDLADIGFNPLGLKELISLPNRKSSEK